MIFVSIFISPRTQGKERTQTSSTPSRRANPGWQQRGGDTERLLHERFSAPSVLHMTGERLGRLHPRCCNAVRDTVQTDLTLHAPPPTMDKLQNHLKYPTYIRAAQSLAGT